MIDIVIKRTTDFSLMMLSQQEKFLYYVFHIYAIIRNLFKAIITKTKNAVVLT